MWKQVGILAGVDGFSKGLKLTHIIENSDMFLVILLTEKEKIVMTIKLLCYVRMIYRFLMFELLQLWHFYGVWCLIH